ncbi:hypothetical protein PSI22_00325 [Xenorhabdus sp. XENO-7]|uniref:Uncharacterized protein n=1 Tax=Xenorhabdus aichiensis TaxID=3025874 RepID=A0ABT5LXG5_9GAMM|nr:hypothetical protein [Xenorhabdus aichiensis]MDC9620109.1 hypothetical protein [Xenorhabdus aichiensis]
MAVRIEVLISDESGELQYEVFSGAATDEYSHQEYQEALRLAGVIRENLTQHGADIYTHLRTHEQQRTH